MERKSRISVKLQLKQPKVMCAGRQAVSCYYRGTLFEENGMTYIEFKYKGKDVVERYDMVSDKFENEELENIKITYMR